MSECGSGSLGVTEETQRDVEAVGERQIVTVHLAS